MRLEKRPLFEIVAHDIEDEIVSGALHEGEQIPSWYELAVRYEISPSTASAATNKLAHNGLLEMRRGVGMFVASAARERLRRERIESFEERFVAPLLAEAHRLDLDMKDLGELIARHGRRRG